MLPKTRTTVNLCAWLASVSTVLLGGSAITLQITDILILSETCVCLYIRVCCPQGRIYVEPGGVN